MRRVGHIRERSPGSWELRYAHAGRTITTTVRGVRKDAERELRRLLRSIDTSEHVEPSKMTVAQWLEQWLETVKHEVAPRSWDRYSGIARTHLIPDLGAVLLTKLAPAQIQSFYNRLAEGGRGDSKAGPLAPRSRRQIHRVLSQALGQAVEQQALARNPCDVFRRRLPKVERKEMAVLTAEQSRQLLDKVRGSALHMPCLLALSCGLRRGEALALRWKHVELDRASLVVAESLEQTREGLRFKAPKSGRSRIIVLPASAVAELRSFKRGQAECY
jgi:integrase